MADDPVLDPQYSDAIKGFEGFVPKAAWDYQQYTNGYGTKAQYPGEVIDRDTAQQRFDAELATASKTVDSIAPNAPAGVKAALTSLTFNAGPGWTNSGLGAAVKAGDWGKAQEIFTQYNKAGGQVNPALVARRQAEAQWFNAPANDTQTAQAPSPAGPAADTLKQTEAQAAPTPQTPVNPFQATAAPTTPVSYAQPAQPLGIPQQQAPQFPQASPIVQPSPLVNQYLQAQLQQAQPLALATPQQRLARLMQMFS